MNYIYELLETGPVSRSTGTGGQIWSATVLGRNCRRLRFGLSRGGSQARPGASQGRTGRGHGRAGAGMRARGDLLRGRFWVGWRPVAPLGPTPGWLIPSLWMRSCFRRHQTTYCESKATRCRGWHPRRRLGWSEAHVGGSRRAGVVARLYGELTIKRLSRTNDTLRLLTPGRAALSAPPVLQLGVA